MAPELASPKGSSSPATASQQSPWHSPVPYLFGGLAALLVLIVFALLILACSYFKLYNETETREDVNRDLESGNHAKMDNHKQPPVVYEEKYLVIMAGQATPTFLATPVSSKVISNGDMTEKSSKPELEVIEENEKNGFRENS
ncbi:protein GLUTAMINE DUMPER 5-like [Rutidosis leptorrhynchoides]|uniref:protein GLUTAMINE DUMPER 5-like n=1 Tax=Rutidosis leptorrhynchoides TaxID=125765 RepID=UPI003A99994D